MDYQFSGQGRRYSLTLEGDREKGYRLLHDDGEHVIRPVSLSENQVVLEIDGRRETLFLAEDRDHVYVLHRGRQYTLNRSDGSEDWGGEEAGFEGGDSTISTPMPGRVVKVLVEPEQDVDAGQPVFIIESMKMENEVKAHHKGKVKSVHAAEGDSLNHGDLVVELYPPEGEEEG
jgi:biotin carboxyl carrier protein